MKGAGGERRAGRNGGQEGVAGPGAPQPSPDLPAYLEGDGQRLVAPPVGRQHGAQEVGAVGAHQLSGVVGQYIHDGAHLGSRPGARRGGPQRPAVLSHLTAGECRGGGCEAPAGARVYGNTHHNSGRQGTAAAGGDEEWPGEARRPPLGCGAALAAGRGGGAPRGRLGQQQPGPAPPRSVPADFRARRGGPGRAARGGCSCPAPGRVSGGLAAVPPAPPGERRRGAPAQPRRGRARSAAGGSPPPGGPESSSPVSAAPPGTVFTAGPGGAGRA